jgi:hypothetical protein
VSHFAPWLVVRQSASSGAVYHREIAALYDRPFELVEALSVDDTHLYFVKASDSRCTFSLVRLPKTLAPADAGPDATVP